MDPAWIKNTFVGAVAKGWNIVWEFKSVGIFLYSFYTSMKDIVVILATQSLPDTCISPPIIPR